MIQGMCPACAVLHDFGLDDERSGPAVDIYLMIEKHKRLRYIARRRVCLM